MAKINMGKMILYTIMVLAGVLGLVFIANSQNKTKSLQDTASFAPPSPIPTATPTTPPQPIAAPEVAGPASESAQQQPNAQAMLASQSAVLKTSKGDIAITLYGASAPNAVYNFVTKAKSGFYNNLIFHRIEDWVVQGGDPKGDGSGGGKMSTEINNLPFVVGSIGVARGNDIRVSNDSQFFITKQESSWLNEQYTNFGIVTEGMDVVNKLEIGDKILGITVE